MRSYPLRIGIIGAGNVLEAYMPQCDKLARRGLARLVAVCGRPRQRDRALELGTPHFTTDEREILNSDETDIVVILAPIAEHARLARAGLEAGKHILMEKPLATELSDAALLLSLAREKDCALVCAPFTVLSPTFQAVSRRVRLGQIGKPCLARARYGWSGPWWSEWFYKPGGGCLFDLGVYCITSLTGLLGPVRRVSAMTGIAIPERQVNGRTIQVEVEDNAQITLEFANGALATVMTGFTIQQYRNPALEIYGSTGMIQMLGDDWDPDGYELWQNSAGCWQFFKETDPDWPWTDGLRHLVECLIAKVQPLVTPDHAYHVLDIMLQAKRAAFENLICSVESAFVPSILDQQEPGEPAHLLHDRTREHVPLSASQVPVER